MSSRVSTDSPALKKYKLAPLPPEPPTQEGQRCVRIYSFTPGHPTIFTRWQVCSTEEWGELPTEKGDLSALGVNPTEWYREISSFQLAQTIKIEQDVKKLTERIQRVFCGGRAQNMHIETLHWMYTDNTSQEIIKIAAACFPHLKRVRIRDDSKSHTFYEKGVFDLQKISELEELVFDSIQQTRTCLANLQILFRGSPRLTKVTFVCGGGKVMEPKLLESLKQGKNIEIRQCPSQKYPSPEFPPFIS